MGDIMDLFDLSDRVALVTGGNGGIGFGMAEGLAAAGAAVMIAGRDESKNEAAIRALRQAGAKAESVPVDVADEMSCRNMVAATVATLGRLDILVNNAGIGGGKRPEEFALSEWNAILATNLTGVFLTAQAAYPEMKRLGGGKIINIGSMRFLVGRLWLLTGQARVGLSNLRNRSRPLGPPTTFKSTRCFQAGSTPILRAGLAGACRTFTRMCCGVRPQAVGGPRAT